MPTRLFGFCFLFFSPALAFAAETIFEGYYRIEHEGKPIGYTIQRFSFDSTTQTFEATSFLRAKYGEKVVQESLKARCTDKFEPIAYQYSNQVGEESKSIEGTFKGEIMKLKITEGKKTRDETYKNPKQTFLATFLPFLMVQQKLKLNDTFNYCAVAEEEGKSYCGKAWLQGKESRPGYELFTVMNKYKTDEFTSKMAVVRDPKNADKNIRGEVLSVNTPAKNISTQLVSAANKATEGQQVPNKTLLSAFGNIPAGKMNLVATPPDVELATGPGDMIPSPVPPSDKAAVKKKQGK
jgi:hypothetical protein